MRYTFPNPWKNTEYQLEFDFTADRVRYIFDSGRIEISNISIPDWQEVYQCQGQPVPYPPDIAMDIGL